MAGQIGSIIDQVALDNNALTYGPVQVNSTIWLVAQIYNGAMKVVTYSCNALGDVAFIMNYTLVSGAVTGISQPIHISEGVFAICYRRYNGYSENRVMTFSINSDGSFGSIIANYLWGDANAGSPYGRMLHIAGTTYAVISLFGTTMKVLTFNISNDGASISLIASNSYTMPGSGAQSDFLQISENVYGVFLLIPNQSTLIRTYQISDAGAISFLNSFTLDSSGPPSTRRIAASHVSGDVWAAAYRQASYHRVRTVQIYADGTFGSIVSTGDGLFSYYNANQLLRIPGGAYLLTSSDSGGGEAKTISISDAGVIGSVIDTLIGLVCYELYLMWISDPLYAGWYQRGDLPYQFQSWAFSVTITRGSSYPGNLLAQLVANAYV
jgi:hypothetical protein